MIEDVSVHEFVDQLASRSSTPGGGSAAALMGSMGAALVSMVCHLSIGKKGHESVDELMANTLRQADALRRETMNLMNADIAAFDAVMAAYRLPKLTDDEKSERLGSIQHALKDATRVPLRCAELCSEIISLSRIVAEHGNRNVVTDAGVAVLAAYAGLASARLNVLINIGSIEDAAFVAWAESSMNALLEPLENQRQTIYDLVMKRL